MKKLIVDNKYRKSIFYDLLKLIEYSMKSTTMDRDYFSRKVIFYAPPKTGKSFTVKEFCEDMKIQLFEISFYNENEWGKLFSGTYLFEKDFSIIFIKHANIGGNDSFAVKQFFEKINIWMKKQNLTKRIMLIVGTDEFNSALYEICNGYFEYKFGALSLIEKRKFVKEYLQKEYKKKIEHSTIDFLIKYYTCEAGIGRLKNSIDLIFSWIAVNDVEQDLSIELVKMILGEPLCFIDNIKIDERMGNGLAWTPYGGKILNLEILDRQGGGNIHILGNIKKTMSDSIQISYQVLHKFANELGICEKDIDCKDLYLSIPELAENKDGASMGLAIFIKMYCMFTKKSLDRPIALTGELLLTGDVIKVGGLKEKLNAAFINEIGVVFLPRKSQGEFSRIPDSLRTQFEINFVDNIFELLDVLKSKNYIG